MITNDNTELGRIDFLILLSLKDNNATSSLLGFTLKELNITEVKRSCLCKHINALVEMNLVCQSGKYGKQKMYYITKDGIERLGA